MHVKLRKIRNASPRICRHYQEFADFGRSGPQNKRKPPSQLTELSLASACRPVLGSARFTVQGVKVASLYRSQSASRAVRSAPTVRQQELHRRKHTSSGSATSGWGLRHASSVVVELLWPTSRHHGQRLWAAANSLHHATNSGVELPHPGKHCRGRILARGPGDHACSHEDQRRGRRGTSRLHLRAPPVGVSCSSDRGELQHVRVMRPRELQD